MSEYKHLRTFSDGGARGNPGPAAAGAVVQTIDGQLLNEESKYLGSMTNNQAEYLGLILALETAAQHQPEKIDCFLDSELVVKQLNGEYRVKNEELKPLHAEIQAMIAGMTVTFNHVPRAKNQQADKLVNEALDHHLNK